MADGSGLHRRSFLWLGLLFAALVIGAIVAVGLSSQPWIRIQPTEFSDVTAAQLAEHTGLKGVPSSATRIRYLAYGGLDTETYLYFRAPRADVDAFSKQLTGYVAADEATRQARRTSTATWVTEDGPSPPPAHDIPPPPLPNLRGPGGLERDWWLPYGAAVTRAEGAESRIANVFVIDHPDYSEVWAYMFVE